MRIDKLASVISRGIWLMDPRYCEGMLPLAVRYLNGQKVSFSDDDDEESDPPIYTWCMSPDGRIVDTVENDSGNLYQEAPVGSIVVISIEGTIMKDDWCGSPGTATMSQWVKEAVWSDNVAGIMFKINSGGGSVEGTGEFAEVVKWADAIKPVYAFTDGLLASAAYWIASACRKIFASYATVEIGSIGTAVRYLDNRKAMEMMGYKEHYVNADPSLDKNEDYYQAIDGNYTPLKLHILNPTNDVFMLTVRENRAGKLVETETKVGDKIRIEPLSGIVYLAKAAIDNGLIDAIASFDDAFELLLQEANEPTETIKKSNNMLGLNKFSKLSALAGKAAASITAEDVVAVNEQIVAAKISGVTLVLDSALEKYEDSEGSEATIADLRTQLSTAQTAKKAAEDKLTEATNKISSLETDRDSWKAKAEKYGAKGAEEHTTGKKTGTDEIENTEEESEDSGYFSEADAELAEKRAAKKKSLLKK